MIHKLARFCRERSRRNSLRRIYDKYKHFTMIFEPAYLRNLELALEISEVPGAIVECGVWRGGMLAGISELLGGARTYVLCDSFEGLPPAKGIDGESALNWQADTKGPTYHDNCRAEQEYARTAMSLGPAQDVRFIAGWYEHTLPRLELSQPIALLRLDCDWYDSTWVCLTSLFERVAEGGIVILDDYFTWDGCSRAVHDYLATTKSTARINEWPGGVFYIRRPSKASDG